MKIAAINGSPKGESSNSREVLSIIESFAPGDAPWRVVSQIREVRSDDSVLEPLLEADTLVIAFPLYVDSLPASLLSFLLRYERAYRARREILAAVGGSGPTPQRVFAVVNCGFFEGAQNGTALKMIGHFCASAGLDWRGGVGLGTGEMIGGLKDVPPQAGVRRPVIAALKAVAEAIAAGSEGRIPERLFAQHAFPRPLFKLVGEMGWRQMAKRNGLKWRDLDARPLLHSLR